MHTVPCQVCANGFYHIGQCQLCGHIKQFNNSIPKNKPEHGKAVKSATYRPGLVAAIKKLFNSKQGYPKLDDKAFADLSPAAQQVTTRDLNS